MNISSGTDSAFAVYQRYAELQSKKKKKKLKQGSKTKIKHKGGDVKIEVRKEFKAQNGIVKKPKKKGKKKIQEKTAHVKAKIQAALPARSVSDNDSDDEVPLLIDIPERNKADVRPSDSNISKPRRSSDVKDLKPSEGKKTSKKKRKPTFEDIALEAPQESIVHASRSFFTDEDPTSEGLELFNWLIAPIKTEEFFEKYWEKAPLHIARKSPGYYSHILTSKCLDQMFRNNPLYFSRNVDVVSYENGVKEEFNQEGRAVPVALWDFYSNGCSIRVINPQSYNHKVHKLVTILQEYFGVLVGANVYLTPPNSQGFAPHYDDIEAFIIQLEGRKHWKLYEPKGADVLARDSSPNFKREDLGEPIAEISLEAGDLLYFPRGVIHEGRTDKDAHSLHITVSLYQHRAYVDLLEHALPAALKRAASEDIRFRKGLPLHFLQHVGVVNSDKKSAIRQKIIKNTQNLMHSLVKYIDVDSAADQLGRQLVRDSMPPVLSQTEVARTAKGDGDHLDDGKVYNRVEMGLDTMVRLLRYHCIRLVVDDQGSAKLYYCTENSNVFHGEEEQCLDLDATLVPAVKTLQNIYPDYVAIESLPIDEDGVKVQFVSDLWERGILVTSERLESFDDGAELYCEENVATSDSDLDSDMNLSEDCK